MLEFIEFLVKLIQLLIMSPSVVFKLVLKDADLITQSLILSQGFVDLGALVVPFLDEVLNVDVEVLVLPF